MRKSHRVQPLVMLAGAIACTLGIASPAPERPLQDAGPRGSARPGSGLVGIVETALSPDARPPLTRPDIAGFLPSHRGAFQFPRPYGTDAFRLTEPADCSGQDCVVPVGYSYWRNINNHAGSDTLLAMITLNRDKGGVGPSLFAVNTETGSVTNRGPLFASSDPRSSASGEGWYFSATLPNALYITDLKRLSRYDVISHVTSTVFDIDDGGDVFGQNRAIWQVHSSNDDQVHSFTVNDAQSYAHLGCGVYHESTREFAFFPTVGHPPDFDECQIDKSGRWLLIKEQVDGQFGEDNRLIDLTTGAETRILDQDGAGGHSDMGYGAMVAEDNWVPEAAVWRLWTFGVEPPGPKTIVYRDINWPDESIVHVSWANATPTGAGGQFVCGSGAVRHQGPRSNEIVCFQLDGSLRTVAVAPVMTDLDAPGGGDDYSKLPKGNLDVSGQYFIWTANADSDRLDAFIVRIPVDEIIRRRAVPRR